MDSIQQITQVVPLVNVSGVWRISGTRVSLDSLLLAYNEGAKPEEIAERFPSLGLPDIYAIIAYYLRNRQEFDAYLTERNHQRSEFESKHDEPGLLDRLLARASMRIAIDEDIDNRVLRGLLKRRPDLDLVRIPDAGLRGSPDQEVLDRAARESRILITCDASTMVPAASDRAARGLRMPGVFHLKQGISISEAVDAMVLLVECSVDGEWEGQIRVLPFR